MRRSILLLPLVVAVSALSGCGQKGPLVMPPARATPAHAASTVHPATRAVLPALPDNDQPSPVDAH